YFAGRKDGCLPVCQRAYGAVSVCRTGNDTVRSIRCPAGLAPQNPHVFVGNFDASSSLDSQQLAVTIQQILHCSRAESGSPDQYPSICFGECIAGVTTPRRLTPALRAVRIAKRKTAARKKSGRSMIE